MAMWYPRHTRRAVRTLLCLSVIYVLIHLADRLGFSGRRYKVWPWTSCADLSGQTCATSRSSIALRTQIIVKTGGSEPQSRLWAQLETILREAKIWNLLVFSDMEETIDGLDVHDVYADMSLEERSNYPEFAMYDLQQEYQRLGKDTRSMKGGWDLAKYMNLAMKRKLWSLLQESNESWDWFVFIDTDTFVDWDNLFMLLKHLDYRDKMYLGSPVWLPGLQFAHGGSAYVLSYGAMQALNMGSAESANPHFSQYGLDTSALCCGDEALARVLKSKGVRLKGYWPMFNGEIPATAPFGPELWCEPVISLHHLDGKAMRDFWEWIQAWKARTMNERPLLFKDLYDYVAPHIMGNPVREDWDNSEDGTTISPKQRAAHDSLDSCHAACQADKLCFQYVYDGTTCALAHYVRLGRERSTEGERGQKCISGWMVDRIHHWTSTTECDNAHWVVSNP